MNPVIRILQKGLGIINNIINGLNKKTVNMIKQSFYLLIFIFIIAGMIIGYNMGKDAATIKNPPLTEYTNQVFEIDMSREKEEGKFGSMLETELINESKYSKKNKIKFPQQENLKPDFDDTIFEPEKKIKIRKTPVLDTRERLFEGKTKRDEIIGSDIRPLKKELKPLENTSDITEKIRSDSDLIYDEKRKKIKKEKKITEPKIIKNDSGIIKN